MLDAAKTLTAESETWPCMRCSTLIPDTDDLCAACEEPWRREEREAEQREAFYADREAAWREGR